MLAAISMTPNIVAENVLVAQRLRYDIVAAMKTIATMNRNFLPSVP